MAKSRVIQVVSHGPSCLDGVVAAAVVARFFDGERVLTTLASNSETDRVIQSLEVRSNKDEIWITDLSWTSLATAGHLRGLTDQGARVFWIDHHRSAVSRAGAPEFKAPFAGKVLSEKRSAALLTYQYLTRREKELTVAQRKNFEAFEPMAEIADDHDRWIHKIDHSEDWALAVQTLGGMAAYRELKKLTEPRMTRRLREAFESGRDAMHRSRELADSTRVDRVLADGVTIRTACCFGYSSEVAAHLYNNTRRTVVALFDLRSQGVSLRRSPDCDVDLARLAESFGGGGHVAASGFMLPDLKRIPAEKLSDILAAKLSPAPQEPL